MFHPQSRDRSILDSGALEEFQKLKTLAYGKGFLMVSSSPFTRSSFHADEDYEELKRNRLVKGLNKRKDLNY